jgi:hypothetical protein
MTQGGVSNISDLFETSDSRTGIVLESEVGIGFKHEDG